MGANLTKLVAYINLAFKKVDRLACSMRWSVLLLKDCQRLKEWQWRLGDRWTSNWCSSTVTWNDNWHRLRLAERHSFYGFLKDQFRTAQSSNSMASADREPITGVRSPPAGVQGAEPPVGDQGAKAPWSWMPFCFCVSRESCIFAPLLIFAKVSKTRSEWMSHCLKMHLQRIYPLSRRAYPLTVALEFRQV